MDKYSDYLRQDRRDNILQSICVHPKQKMIYYKPGKAAGTSIFRKVLQPMGGWIIKKDNPIEFNQWLQNITDAELDTYYKFIFVRNPFSRLVSAWNAISKLKYPNFKDFVKRGVFDKNGNPRKLHFQLQSSLIETPDKFSLGLSFVGKVENIQEDWLKLCQDASIKYQPLGMHAVGQYDYYDTYYDDETRKLVAEMYARDLEIFEYSSEEK